MPKTQKLLLIPLGVITLTALLFAFIKGNNEYFSRITKTPEPQ